MAYKDLAWSQGYDWQSSLTFLQAQGRLPRQAPLRLCVERTWKVITLKDGGFSLFFLSVCLLHTPTVGGIGLLLYFGDSSVFP